MVKWIRYTVTVDIPFDDVNLTLNELINQYNFCTRYQTDLSFIKNILDESNADVEVTSIEELE